MGRKPSFMLLCLAACVAALLVVVGSASASKFHGFKELFGSAAQPTFTTPRAIAVDQSTGDVLVMDAGSPPSIKRYNPDGTAADFSALSSNAIDGQGGADETPQAGLSFASASESQIAVDNSGTATDGDIYVTQGFPNLINVFASTGAYLGQLTASSEGSFSEACGVAVDPSGAVYVGDYSGGIHKFVPAANPPVNADNSANFSTVSQPCTLAAGAGATAGFLFPATYFGAISKIDSSTGELKYTVSSDFNTTVSVDPESGHVYGATESRVKEFDASGAGSATAVSSTALSSQVQGIAVRGSSGDIYVSREGQSKVEVFGSTLLTSPDVTTTAASAVTATEATLNGTVNPDGVGLTQCKFEYGKTTAYGETVPCAESTGSIGSGTSPVPVHADIGGLDLGGAVYHFRLVAVNPEASTNGNDQSFATKGPEITDTWAEGVTVTEGLLKAEINPKGLATTYRFEYGTSTAYGSESGELNVGSDSSPHKVTFALEGLQPGTEYHYRVVATNADAVNEGPDRQIRTFRPFSPDTGCPNQANRYGAGANLPDCRAYEMVSPLDKGSGDLKAPFSAEVGWSTRRTHATPGGGKLTYTAYTAFADALSAPWASQYIAQRTPTEGWQTHAINLPSTRPLTFASGAVFAQYQTFSDDLCHGWVRNYSEPPLSPAGLPETLNIYRRNDRLCGSEGFEAVAPITEGPVAKNSAGVYSYVVLEGVSDDGSHAVFVSRERKLAPEGTEGRTQLYESTAPEAAPRFVCILPNGEPYTGNCVAGTGDSVPSAGSPAPNRISADGSRIFWAAAFPGTGIDGPLYVRIDGSETVAVSAAGEAEAGTTKSWFEGAAADGSRALYTTRISGDEGDKVLFAFDVDTEETERIAAGVYGVAAVSDDARRVYFVSREVLPGSGRNSEGDEAIEDRPNLYLYDADEGGSFAFVGTLRSADTGLTGASPLGLEVRQHSAIATADGRYLAFAATASLTGYDNEGGTSGILNDLAYVYDAQSDQLACASCIPSGARGGRDEIPESFAKGGLFHTYSDFMLPVRSLVAGRLFFNTTLALTPRDSNGKLDVYEWEQAGVGGCNAGDSTYAPSARGCISLISSGTSEVDSEFGEASATGDDAFFYTTSSLVPQDSGLRDIYDARVGGGFPLPPEAPECVGDACQSIPAAPNDPTPASASFRGAGDPAPRRNCRASARRAARLSRRAKHLRRVARRSSLATRKKALRRRSGRSAKAARRLSKNAKRCRRANRR
ncbi:MAG TPA: hypothetical protein VFG58_10530, partial [Solirubrobacterales bacterium]|nr:hypothetical protein [Solirubrobacterales bacterium]